jgi:membrane protein DedA with SNARE-associated domain
MIGRIYGDQAMRWFWRFLGMPPEQVSKFEKAFDNAEWFVVPFFVGSNIVWVLSGAARSSWKRLVPLALVGLAGRLALLWWLADVFYDQVKSTMTFVDRYQWWFLGGSILIVARQRAQLPRPMIAAW